MIGVEFVESKESREPLSKDQFQKIWNRTKDFGVLFGNLIFTSSLLITFLHTYLSPYRVWRILW